MQLRTEATCKAAERLSVPERCKVSEQVETEMCGFGSLRLWATDSPVFYVYWRLEFAASKPPFSL